MARKFTKTNVEDIDAVRDLLRRVNPTTRFYQFYYVRDDRIWDIEQNTVYVDDPGCLPYDYSVSNKKSCVSNNGILCRDLLSNCIFEDGELRRKVIHFDFADNVIRIFIDEDLVLKPSKFYYHLPDVLTPEEGLEFFSQIKGFEEHYQNMKTLYEKYKSTQYSFSLKTLVEGWMSATNLKLFDKIDFYSNLLSYSTTKYVYDFDIDNLQITDLYDIVPGAENLCTNDILPPNIKSNSNYNMRLLMHGGFIWKLSDTLSKETFDIIIDAILDKKIDLYANAEFLYLYGSSTIEKMKHESFLIDFLNNYRFGCGNKPFFSEYFTVCNELRSANMELNIHNIPLLKQLSAAAKLGVSEDQIFGLVMNLNTKQGILDFIEQTK